MAKQSGLGDNFYIGGYDLSGDVGSLGKANVTVAPIEVTGINKSALERIYGLRDAEIGFTSFFDNGTANTVFGNEHQILSSLPTADTVATYFRGTTLGGSAFSVNAKQVNYDGKRDNKGDLTLDVDCKSNQFGGEWGTALTAGVRTDSTATNGTSVDNAASTAFGAQMYLQVFAVTGTSVTVTVGHSADNSTFTTLAAFTAVLSGAPHSVQRISVSNSTTVNRYVRVQTTGTFTNAQFAVMIARNSIAGTVF